MVSLDVRFIPSTGPAYRSSNWLSLARRFNQEINETVYVREKCDKDLNVHELEVKVFDVLIQYNSASI